MKQEKLHIITAIALLIIPVYLSAQKPILSTNGQDFLHQSRPPMDNNQGVSQDVCPNTDFRSIDGTCNNVSRLDRVEWGASDIALLRSMLPEYGSQDHYNAMGGEERPSPRAISNAVSSQTESTPSQAGLSSFVFTWGQFLDHDISLTPEAHLEYEPIVLPQDEPLFNADIPFFRSAIHEDTGTGDYRQQSNLITSYIDGSNVYGSDEDRANWLRSFTRGKLKVSEGGLLPYNTLSGEYDDDIDPNAPSMAGDGDGTVKTFVAGDVRAVEQPGLTSMHTLFVRHHNSLCDQLFNQGMRGDELIYQTARKMVGATLQAITYNEFLPALGVELSRYRGYRDRTQADITNLFASAAYRLGHTMVTDEVLLRSNNCEAIDGGSLTLLEAFFNPAVVAEYNIAPLLKGLSLQTQNEVDLKIIDNLRNFLFGDPSSGNAAGLDLASLNIQRGRDHGLPNYNAVRRHYTGRSARNFRDITRDSDLADALETLYGDVNNVDLWVGLLAEDKQRNTSLGRTLHAIMESQFENLRDGDRFFYLNDRSINRDMMRQIERTKLSDVILSNTNLTNIQDNVFIADNCNAGLANINIEERSVGLSEDLELTTYPNPTSVSLNVELKNIEEAYNWQLVDANGKLIYTGTQDTEQFQIDASQLSNGLYILKINTKNQELSESIVIQRD